MKIFPAIDIINGECVRLTKGLAENKTIYDKSPVEMAKIYQDKGFETIHVVDLDATLGKGSNDKTLELVGKNIDIKIEVAGGIRDKAAIQTKINQGFDIIVIGTFAIKGIDEVSKFENNILDKISVAIDLKDNKIASHGWQQTSTDSLESIVNIYNALPIHSFFVTDVANDGMLSGLNMSTFESIKKLTDKKITIGGGVKDLSDVQIGIKNGFDHMDRRLLTTMIEKFDGGPVGIDSLAAAISEERDTIEDVLEPYLIQQGFIQRTPRGRVITQFAYRHFGLEPSQNTKDLFQIDKAN